MKPSNVLMAALLLSTCVGVSADGSFRLENGKLIQAGASKQEVILIAGAPAYQEVETIAVDDGSAAAPVKREVLTYRLSNSAGSASLVVITVENNVVVSVQSKQGDRT